MSDPLQSIPEVARQTGASREQVRTALKRSNLEPVQTMKMGMKLVPLYAPAPAAKVVNDFLADLARAETERIEAEAAAAARAADQDAAPALSAIVAAVSDLIDRSAFTRDHALAAIEANAADTQTLVEQLLEMVKKISDQNVILFRAVKDMETDHNGRPARLQNTLVAINRGEPVEPAAPTSPAPPPIPPMVDAIVKSSVAAPGALADALQRAATRTPAAPAAAARKLARIVVVGLKGSDKAAIEKEFKGCFDLVLVEVGTGDPPRSFEATVRNSDRVVLAFGSSTMTRVKTALRGSGANVVHVNGGMSRLRDTLTSLYVQLNEKEPA